MQKMSLSGICTPDELSSSAAVAVVELLLSAAWLHVHDGDSGQALAAMEQARAFSPQGDATLSARIDQLQGTQLFLCTRFRDARPMLERARVAALQRGDRTTELAVSSVLARLAYRQGDRELMRRIVSAVNRHFGDCDTSLDLVLLRYAEAILAAEAGDTATGKTLLERQPMQLEEPAHYQIRFWYSGVQMAVCMAEGRLAEAEQLMRYAERHAEAMSNGRISSHITFLLADTLLAQGALEQADTNFARALRTATAHDIPRQQCGALLGRARIAELRGDCARAYELVTEAVQIARAEGYARFERRGLMLLGHALAGLGRHAAATEAFALARAADEAFGHRVQAAEAAVAEARMHQMQGEPAKAQRQLEPYLPLLLGSELLGAEDPIRTLGTAARILLAVEDPRGRELWARAGALLNRRVALVSPERRQSFLQLTPIHRALLNALEPGVVNSNER